MKTKLLALVLLLALVCTCLSGCFDWIAWIGGGADAFSDEEKAAMNEVCGFELPFITCAQYDFYSYGAGFIYTAIGYTDENRDNYINNLLPEQFISLGAREDSYGDLWYEYYCGGWNLSVTFSEVLFTRYMDVFIYPTSHLVDGVKSNAGAGLPMGESGLLKVDFSATEHSLLKSFTDNKYACPSVGEVNLLVLPICFKSDTDEIKAKLNMDELTEIFNGESGVADYFEKSSFGKLNMSFDVYPELITSSYSIEDWLSEYSVNDILLSALTELEDTLDLGKYDSDGDGCIDSVIMVNTLDMSDENMVQWAYKSQNYITNSSGDGYFFDGLGVSNYVWLSGDFIYDEAGEPTVKTLVHEITHAMGVPDYYSTDYLFPDDPVYGQDVMSDAMMDHSPFTKFALGWITEATLLTDISNAEIALGNFWETGEALIAANDFDPALGCFQEYYIIMYSLGESGFSDGLVVYHINASIMEQKTYNQMEVYLYNNNDSYVTWGSEDNLIEILRTDAGLSMPIEPSGEYNISATDDKGEPFSLDFCVLENADGRVVLKFK